MSTKLNTNGQAARKSLAEQIDRLDGMLDGLSDGLSEAVAAAVKDAVGAAVQQAVQTVLREMLASSELLARLHAAATTAPSSTAAPAPAAVPTVAPSPAAPKASNVNWKQRWASVRQALAACVAMARMECVRRLEQARRWAAGAWERVCVLGRWSYPLVKAVVVGVTAGVAACYARPWLAAAVSGVGGLAATVAGMARTAWNWLTTPTVAWIG